MHESKRFRRSEAPMDIDFICNSNNSSRNNTLTQQQIHQFMQNPPEFMLNSQIQPPLPLQLPIDNQMDVDYNISTEAMNSITTQESQPSPLTTVFKSPIEITPSLPSTPGPSITTTTPTTTTNTPSTSTTMEKLMSILVPNLLHIPLIATGIVSMLIYEDYTIKYSQLLSRLLLDQDSCATQYTINKCMPQTRVPALDDQCKQWEKCMNSPVDISRWRILAECLADVVEGFVGNVSYKSIGFILCVLYIVAYAKKNQYSFYSSGGSGSGGGGASGQEVKRRNQVNGRRRRNGGSNAVLKNNLNWSGHHDSFDCEEEADNCKLIDDFDDN